MFSLENRKKRIPDRMGWWVEREHVEQHKVKSCDSRGKTKNLLDSLKNRLLRHGYH